MIVLSDIIQVWVLGIIVGIGVCSSCSLIGFVIGLMIDLFKKV